MMTFDPITESGRSAPQDNMGTSPTQKEQSKTNKITVPIKQYNKATKKFDGEELNITVYLTKGTKIINEDAFKTEVQHTYKTAVRTIINSQQTNNIISQQTKNKSSQQTGNINSQQTKNKSSQQTGNINSQQTENINSQQTKTTRSQQLMKYTFSVKNHKFSVYKERTGFFGRILNLLFGPKKIYDFKIMNFDNNPTLPKKEKI